MKVLFFNESSIPIIIKMTSFDAAALTARSDAIRKSEPIIFSLALRPSTPCRLQTLNHLPKDLFLSWTAHFLIAALTSVSGPSDLPPLQADV